MAFFGKNNTTQDDARLASKEAISSILSQEMRITGEIFFKGKARIDGQVTGNVQGEHLVLSESGKIIGDVNVSSLVCHGTIEGNIDAKLVTALPTAAINGTLVSANLTVESGAFLNGEIKSSQQDNLIAEKQSAGVNQVKKKKEAGKIP